MAELKKYIWILDEDEKQKYIEEILWVMRWFKHGDKPEGCELEVFCDIEPYGSNYPAQVRNRLCDNCGHKMGDHAMAGNKIICPGDYLLFDEEKVDEPYGPNFLCLCDVYHPSKFEGKAELI